jgi:hypothetical protein
MAYGDNYTTKKKKEDLGMSKADVPPPSQSTQSLALKDVVNKSTTTNLVNKSTGKVTGFEYAPGKFILPKGNAITPEQQMQIDYERNQQAEAYAQSQQPKITPQEVAQVGQINPNTLNPSDPLSQDIIANLQGQQDYAKVLDNSGTPLENGRRNIISLTSRLVNPAVKILNKVSFGAQLGDQIVNELSKDEEVKRIIKGFDTAQDVADIRKELARVEALKDFALSQAKTDPIKAKQNYEEYLSIKRRSLNQMKALTRDPKQFIALKSEIAILNDYFDESKGIKYMDDLAMATALNTE